MTIPKFRAYIKATSEMCEVAVLDMFSRAVYLLPSQTIDMGRSRFSFNEIKLMQYIGRKDINDKEIYRGDILRSTTLNKCIMPHINRPTFEVTYNANKSAFSCDEIGCNRIYEHEFAYLSKDSEIIGNIYQNPELLSEETTNE